MKKIKQIFKSVILWGLLIVCAVALWDGVFSCYIPWTRTWFPDHQAYLNMLVDEQRYGQSYFIQEIPDDSPEVQYYWHRDIKTKQAAHAMVLSEESYEEIVSRQIGSHTEDCGNMTSLVYEVQDGEFCYIDDSEWYEQNLKFLDKIL